MFRNTKHHVPKHQTSCSETPNNFHDGALDSRTMKHGSLSGASPPDPHAFGGTGFLFTWIKVSFFKPPSSPELRPVQLPRHHPNYVRYSCHVITRKLQNPRPMESHLDFFLRCIMRDIQSPCHVIAPMCRSFPPGFLSARNLI